MFCKKRIKVQFLELGIESSEWLSVSKETICDCQYFECVNTCHKIAKRKTQLKETRDDDKLWKTPDNLTKCADYIFSPNLRKNTQFKFNHFLVSCRTPSF